MSFPARRPPSRAGAAKVIPSFECAEPQHVAVLSLDGLTGQLNSGFGRPGYQLEIVLEIHERVRRWWLMCDIAPHTLGRKRSAQSGRFMSIISQISAATAAWSPRAIGARSTSTSRYKR